MLDAAQDRLTRLAQALHREADQQRHEQGLQHDLPDQRGDQRGRDDAEQEVGRGSCLAAGRRLLTRGPGGVGEMQARTRLKYVADNQPDDQGERRHDDEVEQGQAADLADLRRLPDGADAEHDRAEDHRTDHHLDQAHERGAQRLERLTDVGGDQADDDAEHHGGNHRDIEVVRAIARLGGGGALHRPGQCWLIRTRRPPDDRRLRRRRPPGDKP